MSEEISQDKNIKDNKNLLLEEWKWINTYPYNERWVLEKQVRESTRRRNGT